MEPGGAERLNISGIILHVEDCGDQPTDTLTFYKAQSRTVSIGRKSSGATAELDPERALFRCQVVSRKHAKITFTEFGNVYITDLHSHHGTHILRPGDFVSTPLTPEQPTVLADGDLITFGKTVGRDECLVRPVVVRLELIFGGDAPARLPPPSPKVAAMDYVPPSPSQHDEHNNKTRGSTGRYGIFLPSPETSSSSSDGDSDIQEISPPPSPRSAFARVQPITSFSPVGRLRLLQQFLPPIHFAQSLEPDFIPVVDSIFFEEMQTNNADIVAEEEDMSLSSSRSPSVAHLSDVQNPVLEEPAIIGAWPGSPPRESESPRQGFAALPRMNEYEVIEISDDDASADGQMSECRGNDAVIEEGHGIEMGNVIFGEAEPVADVQIAPPAPPADDEPVQVEVVELHDNSSASVTFDTTVIEAQIADTVNELVAMRDTRNQDEAAFSTHVQQTKSRLDAIDARVHDTQASLTARNDDLSAIQTRLKGLDSVVSNLQERSMLAERLEELMTEVGVAKDMLQETCALQEMTRAQMAEELEAVRALRIEATAAVAEAKAVSATIQGANALKRKREDDVEGGETASPASVSTAVLPGSLSKRRRTMRVVSAIAEKATLASLGAVAAWGALAYS